MGTIESNPNQKPETASISFADHVGKIFRQKNTEGRRAEYRYKILEFIPAADFGRRGKLPAFRVHRLNPTGIHQPPCVEFLKDFETAPEQI